MYDIDYMPQAESYFKKLKDKPLKKKYLDAIIEIGKDPYAGEAKVGDLSGVYCWPIKCNNTKYDIAYVIKEIQGKTVIIIMAGTRENFYEILKSYMKKSKSKDKLK